MLEFLQPAWNAPDHIKALTTTRNGGLSVAPYASLNVGDHVGDNDKTVASNRQLLLKSIELQLGSSVSQLQWLRQEHTTNIATDSTLDVQQRAYDGQFSRQTGVVCAVMTADCLPVFMCNQAGTEIALVHAGWRGLADGIVETAMSLFSEPAEQLLVHSGPAISQEYFEIGHEVKEQLGGAEQYYRAHPTKSTHCYADLAGLLGERVQALGANFTQSQQCTYADNQRFFSYRRDGVTGRMVSLLWIESSE